MQAKRSFKESNYYETYSAFDIRELIESVDIVEYISQFADLEERGEEYWGSAHLPIPPEHTPSFSVRKESNFW